MGDWRWACRSINDRHAYRWAAEPPRTVRGCSITEPRISSIPGLYNPSIQYKKYIIQHPLTKLWIQNAQVRFA